MSLKNTKPISDGREYGLDGLRGLAALSVVVWHFVAFLVIPKLPAYAGFDNVYKILSKTPVSMIWGGKQAVMLFFVLSGFALYRMLDKINLNIPAYYIRRIFRLWIPYAFSIGLGYTIIMCVGKAGNPEANLLWNPQAFQIKIIDLLNHAALITNFNSWKINAVIWSLVHEMRLSLIFPLIYFLLKRWGTKAILPISVAVSVIAVYYMKPDNNFFLDITSVRRSLIYQLHFITGASIAHNAQSIRRLYHQIPASIRIGMFFVAMVLYSNPWGWLDYFVVLVSSGFFVATAISSDFAKKLLGGKYIQYLGKISFSLYLIHLLIFRLCIQIFYPTLTLFQSLVIALPFIALVSILTNRFIETPSNIWGGKIARNLIKGKK